MAQLRVCELFATWTLRSAIAFLVVYDDIEGLNLYNDYGMFRELFADPTLAADKRYAEPWYYEQEPRPGVSVIGARLRELAALR
jgi:hypothetical protein